MPLIPQTATLLIIDLQERLVPAIIGHAAMIANARLLAQVASLLGNPIVATEQYPKGLGHTLPDLVPAGLQAHAKTSFDAMAVHTIANRLAGATSVVVIGCEAHVCVLQTVVSLCARGKRVWVVADATGSRTQANHLAALDRMAAEGAAVVTAEMVVFEWLRDAGHEQFKAISALIK
jgi:nicotinamidase-related amidase